MMMWFWLNIPYTKALCDRGHFALGIGNEENDSHWCFEAELFCEKLGEMVKGFIEEITGKLAS